MPNLIFRKSTSSEDTSYIVARLNRNVMLNQSCSFLLSNKLPTCAVFYVFQLNSFGRASVTLSSFVDEKWLDQMPSKYYEQLKVKSLLEQVITTFTLSNIGPTLCSHINGRNGVGLKELEENLQCTIKLLPKQTCNYRLHITTLTLLFVKQPFIQVRILPNTRLSTNI